MEEIRKDEGENRIELTLTATRIRDTERFHRYNIDDGQAAMGHVYIEKGKRMPVRVTIELLAG